MSFPMAVTLDARTEAYADVKGIIYQVVHKFCSRHKADFDEMLSIANLAFCECWPRYDSNKARFTTHVYLRVYYAMLETCRKNKRRSEVFQFVETDASELSTARKECFVVDLLDELSTDARTIVNIVLNGRETSHVMQNSQCNNTAASTKNAIAKVLNEIGWSTARVIESFMEIEHALSR